MKNQPLLGEPTCVDPARCADCPPDRICAWACEQGWGMHDIATGNLLVLEGVIPPHHQSREAVESTRQAMWDCYN